MPPRSKIREGLVRYGRICLDATGYAVVLAGLLTLGALVAGIATGGGFVRAKILLFGAGWVTLGYATVKLWPRSPEDDEATDPSGRSLAGEEPSTRFQEFVARLPPMRWVRQPPAPDRITPEGKLFLAAILALAASYVMESWFGIA